MRITKYLLFVFIFVCSFTTLEAQEVKAKIILLPDNKTYQVSIIPDFNFSPPLSTTNSGFITLVAPVGGLEVTNVRSITGNWISASELIAPIGNHSFSYFSYALQSPIQDISYQSGTEIILFTFENNLPCLGDITIIDHVTDPLYPEGENNVQVGNLFTILGAFGDAYSGNEIGNAPCPEALGATATATVGNLNCPGDVTTMEVQVMGGEPPYTITWTNALTGAVDSIISNQLNTPVLLQNIGEGNYTVEIKDVKNSISVINEVVNAPAPIEVVLNITNANCEESFDGGIEILEINRTSADIQYEWSNGLSSTTQITNLSPDTYILTVTDENGCTMEQEVIVKMDGWMEMESESADISCFGMGDGTINVSTSGKNPPFSYNWDNGTETGTGNGNTANFSGLQAGTYQVTVTDGTGVCNQVQTLVVNEPAEITATALVDSSSICELETESVVTIEGVGNTRGAVTYSADGIEFSNSNRFLLDAGAAYTLTVQDDAGCSTDIDVNIPEPSGLSVDLPEDLILNLGEDLQLEADFAATTDVQFNWSPAEDLSCSDCPNPQVIPTRTTTYTLTVSDENGCVKEASLIVYLSTTRRVFAPSAFSPNGDGQNDLYTIFTSTDAMSVNSFKIYDRWGEKVYEAPSDFIPSDDFNYGWDGRFKGEVAPNGVYVYMAEITFIDGRTEVFTGDLTLAR